MARLEVKAKRATLVTSGGVHAELGIADIAACGRGDAEDREAMLILVEAVNVEAERAIVRALLEQTVEERDVRDRDAVGRVNLQSLERLRARVDERCAVADDLALAVALKQVAEAVREARCIVAGVHHLREA